MEEQKISDKKEIENASIKISPEKKQTVLLPSYTKSYSKTWIESTMFEYIWEIDEFISVSNAIDKLYSPLFPETAEYKIQMNVIREKTNLPLSIKRMTFYLCVTKAFTGSCTTTVIFSGKPYTPTKLISGYISGMTLLIEIAYDRFRTSINPDTLEIQCKFKIFDKQTSNTIHMNLQSYSAVFSKDMGSLEDSILDESANELEDEKSINFIVRKKIYIISKKLLHATNSSYFENICLTHEGKEKDMTNELTDSEIDAFQEILVFIKTGSIRSNTFGMLTILLTTADKYDVPTLKLTCEHYLLRYITVCNAIELIQLAFSSNAKFLETHSATFIKFHIKEIMNTKEFQNLSQESANKIMKLIKKCKVLKISKDQFCSSPA